MDEESFDEEALEEILENSEQHGDDIESTDLSDMTDIMEFSFYLLDLYQRYNEPDNIYVSGLLEPQWHEKNWSTPFWS